MSERTHAGARPQRSEARPVSRPHDRHEREAERAAAEVARGGSVAGWSFSAVPAAPPVQRQEAGGTSKPTQKSEDDKLEEALLTAGKAALKTKTGKRLIDNVLSEPRVKKLTDFATSPAGIAVEGALAAGGLAALRAAHEPLPIQPPPIPIRPGLSVQVDYEGPVGRPTSGSIKFIFSPPRPKRTGPSTDEQYRRETARMALANQEFLSHMTYTDPGSKEAEEQRLLDEAIDKVAADHGLRGFAIPLAPPAKQDDQPQPVQRAPETAAPAPDAAHVDGALTGGGRPLDPVVRRTMEARFGRDFSDVRIHDDARAAATARSIDAAAFTVGQDVAFGPGRYAPATAAGRELLAHELAHTVQQRDGATRVQRQVAPPEAYSEEMVERELAELGKRLERKSYPGRDDDLDRFRRFARVAHDRAAASAAGLSDAQLAATIAATSRTLRHGKAGHELDAETLRALREVSQRRAADRKRAAEARDRAAAVAKVQKQLADWHAEEAADAAADAAPGPEPTPIPLGPPQRGRRKQHAKVFTGVFTPEEAAEQLRVTDAVDAEWQAAERHAQETLRVRAPFAVDGDKAGPLGVRVPVQAGRFYDAVRHTPPGDDADPEKVWDVGRKEGLFADDERGAFDDMWERKFAAPKRAEARHTENVESTRREIAWEEHGRELTSPAPFLQGFAFGAFGTAAATGYSAFTAYRIGTDVAHAYQTGDPEDIGTAAIDFGTAAAMHALAPGGGGEESGGAGELPAAGDTATPIELARTAHPAELARTVHPVEVGKTANPGELARTVDPAELAKTAQPDELGDTLPADPARSPGPRTQPSAPPAARPQGRPARAVAVSSEDAAAAYRADPTSVHRSWHPVWHEQIWMLDGGRGPAPSAFRVGRVIFVAPDFPL